MPAGAHPLVTSAWKGDLGTLGEQREHDEAAIAVGERSPGLEPTGDRRARRGISVVASSWTGTGKT